MARLYKTEIMYNRMHSFYVGAFCYLKTNKSQNEIKFKVTLAKHFKMIYIIIRESLL